MKPHLIEQPPNELKSNRQKGQQIHVQDGEFNSSAISSLAVSHAITKSTRKHTLKKNMFLFSPSRLLKNNVHGGVSIVAPQGCFLSERLGVASRLDRIQHIIARIHQATISTSENKASIKTALNYLLTGSTLAVVSLLGPPPPHQSAGHPPPVPITREVGLVGRALKGIHVCIQHECPSDSMRGHFEVELWTCLTHTKLLQAEVLNLYL